jgi:hypothetical protein
MTPLNARIRINHPSIPRRVPKQNRKQREFRGQCSECRRNSEPWLRTRLERLRQALVVAQGELGRLVLLARSASRAAGAGQAGTVRRINSGERGGGAAAPASARAGGWPRHAGHVTVSRLAPALCRGWRWRWRWRASAGSLGSLAFISRGSFNCCVNRVVWWCACAANRAIGRNCNHERFGGTTTHATAPP